MFTVEYSWDNITQECEHGVRDRDFDTLQQAYDFAAKVLARAATRNRESPLCCGEPEDFLRVDLRICRNAYEGRQLPSWQCTLLTIMFDGREEHAMWFSQSTGAICQC